MNKELILKILAGIIAILAVAGIVSFIYVKVSKVNEIEKMSIENVSKDIISYIYNLDSSYEETEKYTLYALDYFYYNKAKTKVELSDIASFVNEHFNVSYSSDDFIKLGITPEMVQRNITFDYTANTYNYGLELSQRDIATKPIKTYIVSKIKKSGKNKYKVVYTEYTIEEPYTILNYYNDQNTHDEQNLSYVDDNGEQINLDTKAVTVDTTEILSYLQGDSPRSVLDKYLTNSFLEKKAKKGRKVTVSYIVKDSKVLVDKVKIK